MSIVSEYSLTLRHGAKTKELMQETALGLCGAKGVTETTLRDLATAAGLAGGGNSPTRVPFPGLPGGRSRRSRAAETGVVLHK